MIFDKFWLILKLKIWPQDTYVKDWGKVAPVWAKIGNPQQGMLNQLRQVRLGYVMYNLQGRHAIMFQVFFEGPLKLTFAISSNVLTNCFRYSSFRIFQQLRGTLRQSSMMTRRKLSRMFRYLFFPLSGITRKYFLSRLVLPGLTKQ